MSTVNFGFKQLTPFLFLLVFTLIPGIVHAQELIIGEEVIEPGIVTIFEGAIKDDVTPAQQNLAENRTDVHIEARVNWAANESIEVPKGTPRGGFVAYLNISAQVVNERTNDVLKVDLIPHINLVDNFHYARNIALPGNITDPYTVTFFVSPPSTFDLALHKDWRGKYGKELFEEQVFEYQNIDFEEIALSSRR